MKKQLFLGLAVVFLFYNSAAQVIDSILPLNTANWSNAQCGNVISGNGNLYIYGSDIRIGANVHSKSFFDFQHDAEIYIKWQFDPHGHSGIFMGAMIRPAGCVTSNLGTIIPNEWLFTHIVIDSVNHTLAFNVSKVDYDDQGGTVIYSHTYNLSAKQWEALASSDVVLGFNDNYGGTNTKMTVHEVKLHNVIPVDYNNLINGLDKYDFEAGQISADFSFNGSQTTWQVIDTAAYQSIHSLYAVAPVHQEGTLILDVNNAVKVSFDLKYKSETHKYMRFMVDSMQVAVFDAYNNTCWRHFEWQFNNQNHHKLLWKIYGTSNDVESGQLWLDNIRIYRNNTTYTAIPDTNFENALSAYDDITGDHQVPTIAIDTITQLNIGSRNINDLTGIQDFTSLKDLRVPDNHISSIDLSRLYNLELLQIGMNQLTTIDVSQNPNLYYLSCYNNNLNSIDLGYHDHLSYIYVQRNNLTTLDLSDVSSVYRLEINHNQISQLDIGHLDFLHILDISDNPITQIDVTNKPLIWFYAQNTSLTDVDLSTNDQLLKIKVNQCPDLTQVDLRNGNNTIINSFNATGSPNLTCIFVDDPTWWQQNYSSVIEPNTHFVSNQAECDAASIDEEIGNDVIIYPNPVSKLLNVNSLQDTNLFIYDTAGKLLIKSRCNQPVNVDKLSKGIYFIRLENLDKVYKFIKE